MPILFPTALHYSFHRLFLLTYRSRHTNSSTRHLAKNNILRTMATLGAQKKHKVTIVGSGNWSVYTLRLIDYPFLF